MQAFIEVNVSLPNAGVYRQMPEMRVSHSRSPAAGLLSLLCLAAAVFLVACLDPAAAAAQGEFPGKGSSAPPLSFTDISEKEHSWTWPVRGGLSVVFFWVPLSPPSLLEMADLDDIYKTRRDFGLRVAAVEATGLDGDRIGEMMAGYRRLYGYPRYPIVADSGSRLKNLFGIRQEHLPAAFFIGADGTVLHVIAGTYGAAARRELIESIQKGLAGKLGRPETPEATIYSAVSPYARSLPALVGDRISSMRVRDLSGKAHSLNWPMDSGLSLFFFWNPESAPSFEEMVFLDDVEDRAGEYGLRVLAVEAGGLTSLEIEAALEKYERVFDPLSLPVIPGNEAGIVSVFGLMGRPMPETYLVGSDGVVLYRLSGFRAQDRSDVVEAIQKVIKVPSGIMEPVLEQRALD